MALSGGRDSTALLHATVAQATPLGVTVLALHVHHGLSANADAWLDHVRRIAPDYAKVLVRDNPLLPADKRRAQLDDLAHVSDGLRKVNVPLLYELLVPPMPSQLAAANESADRFDRDLPTARTRPASDRR